MLHRFEGIGERLNLMLKLNKITQKEVCEITGISKNAMSNYINEKRVPESLILYKLAKLFRTSMEWILTGKDSAYNESSDNLTDYLRSTAEEIIRRYINYESFNKANLLSGDYKFYVINEIAQFLEMYLKSEQSNSHLLILPDTEYNFITSFNKLPAIDKQALSAFVNTKLCLLKEHDKDNDISIL